ncbi:MAG: hypothetical protein KAU58_03465, partial [Candidatus Omnitrophica bacterium]|nr:hypothetical protein [Candidatus Omnitrophota bacterium]
VKEGIDIENLVARVIKSKGYRLPRNWRENEEIASAIGAFAERIQVELAPGEEEITEPEVAVKGRIEKPLPEEEVAAPKTPDKRFKEEPRGITPLAVTTFSIAAAAFGAISLTTALTGIAGIFIPYLIYKYGILHSVLKTALNKQQISSEERQTLQQRCQSIIGESHKVRIKGDTENWDENKSPYAYAKKEIVYVRERTAKARLVALATILMHEKAEVYLNRAPPVPLKEGLANIGEFIFLALYFISNLAFSIKTFFRSTIKEKILMLEEAIQEEIPEEWLNQEWFSGLRAVAEKDADPDRKYYEYLKRMLTLRSAGMPFDFLEYFNDVTYYKGRLLKMDKKVLKQRINLLAGSNITVKPEFLNYSTDRLAERVTLLKNLEIGPNELFLKASNTELEEIEKVNTGEAKGLGIPVYELLKRKVNLFKYYGLTVTPKFLKYELEGLRKKILAHKNYGIRVDDTTMRLSEAELRDYAIESHISVMAEREISNSELQKLADLIETKILIPDASYHEGEAEDPYLREKRMEEEREELNKRFAENIKSIRNFYRPGSKKELAIRRTELAEFLHRMIFGDLSPYLDNLADKELERFEELSDKLMTTGAEAKDFASDSLYRIYEVLRNKTGGGKAAQQVAKSIIEHAVREHASEKRAGRVLDLFLKAEKVYRRNQAALRNAITAAVQYANEPTRENLARLRDIAKAEEDNPLYYEASKIFERFHDKYILRLLGLNPERIRNDSGKLDCKQARALLGKEGMEKFRELSVALRTLFSEARPYSNVLGFWQQVVKAAVSLARSRILSRISGLFSKIPV